jgi:hypothetical protein
VLKDIAGIEAGAKSAYIVFGKEQSKYKLGRFLNIITNVEHWKMKNFLFEGEDFDIKD